MKTKFSELLKVKKQKVSEIEQALAEKRYEKQVVLDEIKQLVNDVKTLSYPNHGDFSLMKLVFSHRDYLFEEKKYKENMIKYFDQEIEKFNILYKEANIEYEKISHLHEIEEKKVLDELKIQEAKNMDEIANQLFTMHQKKEMFD